MLQVMKSKHGTARSLGKWENHDAWLLSILERTRLAPGPRQPEKLSARLPLLICWIKKRGEKKKKKKKKGAITLLSTFSQFPPALSPLSVVECQGWQGQHGWQGRGGGGQRGRVVHRVAPVGLHHRGLWGGAVRVRGAVLCAAAAAARAAAFVACNARAKRWVRTSQPVSRVHDAISPGFFFFPPPYFTSPLRSLHETAKTS